MLHAPAALLPTHAGARISRHPGRKKDAGNPGSKSDGSVRLPAQADPAAGDRWKAVPESDDPGFHGLPLYACARIGARCPGPAAIHRRQSDGKEPCNARRTMSSVMPGWALSCVTARKTRGERGTGGKLAREILVCVFIPYSIATAKDNNNPPGPNRDQIFRWIFRWNHTWGIAKVASPISGAESTILRQASSSGWLVFLSCCADRTCRKCFVDGFVPSRIQPPAWLRPHNSYTPCRPGQPLPVREW